MRSPRTERVAAALTACLGWALPACETFEEVLASVPPGVATEDDPSEQEPAEATGDPDSEGGSSTDGASAQDDGLILRAPTEPLPDPHEPDPLEPPTGRRAYAWQFNAPIYTAAGSDDIVGFGRRGTTIAVARARKAPGCSMSWWELSTGGWVCPRKGWAVGHDPQQLEERLRTRAPQDAPLPFAYAKVRDEDTPLYARMPTAAQQARAEAAPGVKTSGVLQRTTGVVFLALHRKQTREDGTVFLRDVRGRYVLEAHTHPPKTQTMRAQALDGAQDLPLAFVYREDTPVYDEHGDTIGVAEKFARTPAEAIVAGPDAAQIVTPRGRLPRAAVRLAELAERPDGVGTRDQWVHIDLDRQVLVAYEGETPILATLVSSGKEGYEPPRGLFRIEKKYTTKKMQGADPIDGSYDIDQVPYTMYYWGSLALHGAYWHDDFGTVRSHGCTNLPPHDARWLFRWASPALEGDWHGRVRARGPRVYVTRGEDVYADPLRPVQRKKE